MSAKEAKARIKINKLLEDSGWWFFDSPAGKANIALDPNVKLTKTQVDALGNDFETIGHGFIDFLLLNDKGIPWVVLEAKAVDQRSGSREPLEVYACLGKPPSHCHIWMSKRASFGKFWQRNLPIS
jgi:hypothetical protein